MRRRLNPWASRTENAKTTLKICPNGSKTSPQIETGSSGSLLDQSHGVQLGKEANLLSEDIHSPLIPITEGIRCPRVNFGFYDDRSRMLYVGALVTYIRCGKTFFFSSSAFRFYSGQMAVRGKWMIRPWYCTLCTCNSIHGQSYIYKLRSEDLGRCMTNHMQAEKCPSTVLCTDLLSVHQ